MKVSTRPAWSKYKMQRHYRRSLLLYYFRHVRYNFILLSLQAYCHSVIYYYYYYYYDIHSFILFHFLLFSFSICLERSYSSWFSYSFKICSFLCCSRYHTIRFFFPCHILLRLLEFTTLYKLLQWLGSLLFSKELFCSL